MLDKKDTEKLSEVFTTKNDLDILENRLEGKIVEFKDEILVGQDKILEKLEALSQEKTVGDEQGKRQKKVLKIHNEALKKHKILTDKETLEINGLGVF